MRTIRELLSALAQAGNGLTEPRRERRSDSASGTPPTAHSAVCPRRLASGLLCLLAMSAGPATAADWYASPSGNDTNACDSAGEPCKTIQAAISKAGANDTVHVGQGAYPFAGTIQIPSTKNGLKLIGDNSPFASSSTPGNVSPAANASQLSAASSCAGLTCTGMIWINGAQDVVIQNLFLRVNHGKSNEGIVATGNVNGLVLRNNYLQITATGGKTNAISLNMAAGSNSDQNSTGGSPYYSGIYVTLDGNVVQPTGTVASSRAVVSDYVAGVFHANQFAGSSQDMRLRYLTANARGSGFDIDGNYVYGAGLWITTPNDGSSLVHIHNNHFIAPGTPGAPASPLNASSVLDPDFASLKLVGSSNPTIVENNEFAGYANRYRGLWIQNWSGVTIRDNVFTPNANYNGLSSAILVGNKEVWNGAPAPRQLAVTLLRNTFNAGYANANSRAIVFIDDNDASGTATAGSLLVGDANAANANNFATGLKWYVGLDEHTCNAGGSGLNCSTAAPTNSPLGVGINYTSGSSGNTQGRPFKWDVAALGNKFGGKLVADMTPAEYTAIAGKIYDKVDNSALGKVDYGSMPVSTTGTINFSPTTFAYNGQPHAISATLQEDNSATCDVTPETVTAVGSTPVNATCTSPGYHVTASVDINVTKGVGNARLSETSFTYAAADIVLLPSMVEESASCSATPPTVRDAGHYSIHVTCAGSNYDADSTVGVDVAKAASHIVLNPTSFTYDNTEHALHAQLADESSAACAGVAPASVRTVGSHEVSVPACDGVNYMAPAANLTATVDGGANAVRRVSSHGQADAFFSTIDAALADVGTQDGDTLEMAPGVYSGGIVLTKGIKLVGSGGYDTPMFGLSLLADPTPNVVLDGGNAAATGIAIAPNVQGVEITGFEIRNFTGDCISGAQGNHFLSVHDNLVHHCGNWGVYANGIAGIHDVTIAHNAVHDTGDRAIVLWNGFKRDIEITENHVWNAGTTAISLDDGSAAGIAITDNTIEDSGDTGISALQLTGSGMPGDPSGPNLIAHNTISNPGRFGITLMIPNGTGNDSGDGAIVVEHNDITGGANSGGYASDRAGISVVRRYYGGAAQGQVDATSGVVIRDNTVADFNHTANANHEAYGIVVEGLGSSVYRNTLTNNQIGLQIQQGNAGYPGNSTVDATEHSDWFDRGDAPYTCVSLGQGADANDILSNTTPQREVPLGAAMIGERVENMTTHARYCSINSAIAAAVDNDVLVADAGVYAEDVVINKAITLKGAKAGINAGVGGSRDGNGAGETILVPANEEGGLTLSSYGKAVVKINADDVTLDGFVIDTDNTAIDSHIDLNGAGPDVSGGVFANGNGLTLTNLVVRNAIYAGIDGGYDNGQPAQDGNGISDSRFINCDGASYGIGIALEQNFYAKVTGNRMDAVRTGIQLDNNYQAAPTANYAPELSGNQIQAKRVGIWANLFYQSASTYHVTNNTITAASGGAGQWSGIWVESMQDAQTIELASNTIDASGADAGRTRVGYLLNNIVSSAASSAAIGGGGVSNVDIGVLATDATRYTGSVNDFVVRDVDFVNIAKGALYVEDTTQTPGSAKLTMGAGNTFGSNVAHKLVLSGTAPEASGAVDEVFVRSARDFVFGAAVSSAGNPVCYANAGAPFCAVANASINAGIAAVSAGGTVNVESGTFAENVVVGKQVALQGPHFGVAGDAGARGTGEAIISPASGNGVKVLADGVVVDGLTVQNTQDNAIVSGGNFGGASASVSIINNRVLDVQAGNGIYTNGPYPAATDWTIRHNLVRNVVSNIGSGINYWAASGGLVADNHVEQSGFAGIQAVNSRNVQVLHNTIASTAHSGINVGTTNAGAIADALTVIGNSLSDTNTGASVAEGGLTLSDGATNVVFACNSVAGNGSNGFATGAGSASAKVFHNAFTTANSISQNQGGSFAIGSNWYGGGVATIGGGNAAGARVADVLGSNPIGNANCGDNTPTQLVAAVGSTPQSAPVNTAFGSVLRARLEDALGGAVAGEVLTFTAPVSGASATLGTSSGSTNYNGEVTSTATANATAGGPYNVAVDSGSLHAAFALTNTQGSATITLGNLNQDYTGAPRDVSVATNPVGLVTSITYTPAGHTNAGSYAVHAEITDPNYSGSADGTLTITKATGTVAWDNTSFVYSGSSPTVTAHIAEESGATCTVSGTVGPNVGNYPVSANCTSSNYNASGSTAVTITPQPTTITLSHLSQPYDGAPKSVVATTSPTAGVAVAITYNGSAAPPTAVGSYAVAATVTNANYSGSATATLNIVDSNGDIALVLNGPVDPIHVGDKAQYAATMLANPLLHAGERFGYDVVVSKSNGTPLAATDLATMEVFYGGDWVDSAALFPAGVPFDLVDGNLVYHFPEGIPGYANGFPIEDASWTWNFRFAFATEGTYTTTATLVQGIGGAAMSPPVSASIATVVKAALPPTDIHLVLAGPADHVVLGNVAEYTGTMLANPALHAGETFFVKVAIGKSGGAMTAADFTSMQIWLGDRWVNGSDLGVTFTSDGNGNLVYLFPQSQLPGGFPIEDAQWSWNFRFVYASTGVYTATAQVIPAYQANLANPDVLASAAIATTVDAAPIVPPTAHLVLLGPVDDVQAHTPAEYTGTLVADHTQLTSAYWMRVRLSKTGGAMTPADLEKMEIYAGTWIDATGDIHSAMQQDGNDVVYYFPQPNGAFTISDDVWSWRFRFTYADAGEYTAVADLVDWVEVDPLTAPSLAHASLTTNVVPQAANIQIALQGPVAGIVVGQPAQYVGTLRADPLPDASELFFVQVRLHKSTGQMQVSDLSKMELYNGGWQDATATLQGEFAQDHGDLVYLFPKPEADAGFPIDEPEWSWQFRFTYADAAVYTATAQVVHASDLSPASDAVTIFTDVAPQPADVALQLNGPVADVQANEPAAYIGRLTNTGAALGENAYVKVHITLDNDLLTPADVTAEVLVGGDWFVGSLASDGNGGLVVDFPDASGFPIDAGYDYTHHFRITYHKTGMFSATAQVIGVGSGDVYATSGIHTQVVARSNVTVQVLIDPASLHAVYDGGQHAAAATTLPAGHPLVVTYDDGSGPTTMAPTNAGTYVVIAGVDVGDAPYVGSASAILVIDKAPSAITINGADLHQSYGSTHAVSASASPISSGHVDVTYNGSATPPSAVGTYSVLATLVDPNYTAAPKSAVLTISDAAAITITAESSQAMALVGEDAPYTDFVDYTGTLRNTGEPTSQKVHTVISVVRIDDGNTTGENPIAIDAADVEACIYDPSGWDAQDPGNHNGCPQDYESLVFSQGSGAVNGRPAVTFRYPVNPAYDQALPTIDPAAITPPAKFRFKRGDYQVHVSLVGTDGTVYASAFDGTTVPEASIAYAGATSGQAEDALLSQTRLRNTGGRVDGNVIVRVTLSDAASGPGNVVPLDASDVDFAYQLGDSYVTLPWAGNAVDGGLVTYFGPVSGFPLEDGYDATTAGRGIFHREGSYRLTYEVLDAATQTTMFAHSVTAPLTIGPNQVNFTLSDLSQVYDGTPRTVTVTPNGVPHTTVYEPLLGASCPASPAGSNTTPPTNAGAYCVYVNATGTYQGTAQGTLVIARANVVVTLDDNDGTIDGTIHRTFDGHPQTVSSGVQNLPAVLARVTYNGDVLPPTAAGTYSVVATVDEPNYTGSTSGTLIIAADGGATIVLDGAVAGTITRTYNGSAQAVTATTTPAGIANTVTYVGDGATVYPLSTTAPTNAGQYHVVATTTDANYTPVSASGTLVIGAASAAITLDAGTLSATYDGQTHAVTATTNPPDLAYSVTYDGSVTPPVSAGSYAVVATVTAPGRSGSASGTLTIAKATGVVSFSATNATFDGTSHSIGAVISQEPTNGAACTLTPTGEYPRINAGSTTLSATCNGANYTASGSTTLMVSPKPVTIALSGLGSFPYTGSPYAAMAAVSGEVSGFPAGTVVTYAPGGASAPIAVGSYDVVATLDAASTNYTATPANGTIIIGAANATVTLGNLAQTYDGTQRAATASTMPPNLAVSLTYDGSATPPISAGTYTVVATITQPGYSGSASGTLVVSKKAETVTLANLSATYDGNSHAASATTSPDTVAVTITYDGSTTAPTNAGSYAVVANVSDANHSGSASGTLTIAKASATVALSNLTQIWDGTARPVTVTTTPNVTTSVTYDGSATAPTDVGTYSVAATVTDPNYTGSANGTLHVVNGDAQAIAANGATTFTGTAGQPLAGALPSVKVTDAGGHPVAGIAVTFAAASGNGTLSGATQSTDQNGIATLSGWTLDATPGTDTVTASAAGVTGAVTFTANGAAASGALSVTITDNRTATQVGRELTYTITIGNAGSSNMSGIHVADTLPAELDGANAHWQCIAVTGASCAASGNGDLDQTVSLPAHSSVIYLLTATVIGEDASGLVSNSVEVTNGSDAITRTDDTAVVLFRDGFELGGDGSEPWPAGAAVVALGSLDAAHALDVGVDAAQLGSLQRVTLAQAGDGTFRIEAIRIDATVYVRLVARTAQGEAATEWSALGGDHVALVLDGARLDLVGAKADLGLTLAQGGTFAVGGVSRH